MFQAPLELTDTLISDAFQDVERLYKNPQHRRDRSVHIIQPNPSPTNYVMFYNTAGSSPSFSQNLAVLHELTPRRAEYTMLY